MTVQGKHSTDTVLDPKYPGSDLSIPELCYALKTKLVQADDPRYEHNARFIVPPIAGNSFNRPLQIPHPPPTGS